MDTRTAASKTSSKMVFTSNTSCTERTSASTRPARTHNTLYGTSPETQSTHSAQTGPSAHQTEQKALSLGARPDVIPTFSSPVSAFSISHFRVPHHLNDHRRSALLRCTCGSSHSRDSSFSLSSYMRIAFYGPRQRK